MLYDAFIFWLKSAGVLYVLVSTALYLDQESPLIRKHCRSPRMVALKMALAPLTIVYIAFRITIAWPKFLISHHLAGCFAGNAPPACPPGMRRGEPRRHEGPATACSSAVCRNAIVNTHGPHSVVNEEALEEAYNRFPVLTAEVLR